MLLQLLKSPIIWYDYQNIFIFFFLEKNGIVLINETLQQYDRRHILQKGFRFVWYYRILWSKLSNIGKSPVVYWVLSSHESADIEDRIASRRKINHEHDPMAEIPLSPNDCHNNELYLVFDIHVDAMLRCLVGEECECLSLQLT